MAISCVPCNNLIMRHGIFRPSGGQHFGREDGHLFAMNRMSADRRINSSAVAFQTPDDYRLINSCEAVRFYLGGERVMRRIVFGYYQKTACILVEPVDYPGAQNPADTRKTVPAVGQQRIDKRAVGVARGGMHNHPLGLVYNQKIFVLIYNI